MDPDWDSTIKEAVSDSESAYDLEALRRGLETIEQLFPDAQVPSILVGPDRCQFQWFVSEKGFTMITFGYEDSTTPQITAFVENSNGKAMPIAIDQFNPPVRK